MARLVALSPCAGLLPLTAGSVTLTEVDPGPVWSVAPFAGKSAEVGKVLESALGLPFPAPGTSHFGKGARTLWTGRGRALVIGADLPAGLGALAAVTDQTDAAAVVLMEGAGTEAVLARLVPVDLRPAAFGPGRTARTLVGHMQAQVTRDPAGGIEIMVMRSMAGTLVHDLSRAMAAVAARG